MSRNSELIKNTFLISFAQISVQIANFLLLPVYTAVLSTEEYGRVDLYVTLCMALVCILFLGVEQSIFRFCISEKDMAKKREFFSSGLALAIGSLMIFSIIYTIGNIVWQFQDAGLLYTYFILYGFFYLLLYVARSMERTGMYATATTLGTILTAVFNIIFVICLKMGVRGMLLGYIIAYAVVAIYLSMCLPLRSMIVLGWKSDIVKTMLEYSLPLALNNIMGWIATSSDRLIIVALLGNSLNGIYSLANKFYSILMVMTRGFTIAWAETAVKVVHQPDHKAYYRKIIYLSMDAYFLIISGIITILPFAFERFIDRSYKSAYYHIPIIIYAAFWYTLSAVIGYILLAYKKSREVGIGTFLVAIVNLLVHFLLIGKIGLFAASVSTLVSYIGLFVFRYFFMYQHENIPFPWVKTMVQLCVYLTLCVCYYIKSRNSLLVGLCIYLSSVMMIIKAYRKELNYFVKKYVHK